MAIDPGSQRLLQGGCVAYQRAVAVAVGDAMTGLLLSQMLWWSSRVCEGGWFTRTQQQIYDSTVLTRAQQETARRRLRDLGVLEEQRRGTPALLWFRLDMDRLMELLANAEGQHSSMRESSAENPHTRMLESSILEEANPADIPIGETSKRDNSLSTPLPPVAKTSDETAPELGLAWDMYTKHFAVPLEGFLRRKPKSHEVLDVVRKMADLMKHGGLDSGIGQTILESANAYVRETLRPASSGVFKVELEKAQRAVESRSDSGKGNRTPVGGRREGSAGKGRVDPAWLGELDRKQADRRRPERPGV